MRLWRSLVRVVAVEELPEGVFLRVLVPASLCKDTTRIPAEKIPKEAWKPGVRFFARVNLEAEAPDAMRVEDPIELAAPPDPDDGLAPRMKRFGKGWANLEEVELVEVPVGELCFYCPVPFKEGDMGVWQRYSGGDGSPTRPFVEKEVAMHRTCLLKACGIDPEKPNG